MRARVTSAGMHRRQRRALYYLAALLAVVLTYTLVYQWAMATFENQSRSLWQALLVVVETFTLTGYGEDAGFWTSPYLLSLMIVMQITGVFFIFMALPLFVVPWLEARLEASVPTAVDSLSGHVVICTYTPRSQTLIDELEVHDIPHLVIEPDRDRARDLYEEGEVRVIHGDPESLAVLQAANFDRARALVATQDDESNATIALTADQGHEAEGVQVITFAEDPEMADYHRYAGADHVFTPRTLIGESLANKVTTGVSEEVGDAIEIGEHFEIVELPVQPGSELAGVRVADSGIRERTGANIIGAWFRGEFVSPPNPDALIDGRTILLVAGRAEQLEALKELTLTEHRRRRRGSVLVCGSGNVGSTVKRSVTRAGLPVKTIDVEDRPGVDIVGDATDTETLFDAGLKEASTVILALSDDTAAIFATLVVRHLDEDVEIIARANEAETVKKLYRAGADYVLALATVSGRMLASTILEEDVITFDQQVEVVRMDPGSLAGTSLADADVRNRTGATVIAIERNETIITDLEPNFRVKADDTVVLAGPDQAIRDFSEIFGG
jgi:Trk K+ transport system NAD-binding subunit